MSVIEEKNSGPISEKTLRRLPAYHRFLRSILKEGETTVSCAQIGCELKADPTQIRKDLAVTGISGKPKVGYDLRELVNAIETFLGWSNAQQAFLVGAGNLGRAILGYRRFSQYGLDVVSAFDTDESKIGMTIHGAEVLPLEKMADLARRMHVLLGIITVDAESAQYVADQMVAGGMRAIWNFAPVNLNTPPHVIVQNEDLYASLAVLSRRLGNILKAE